MVQLDAGTDLLAPSPVRWLHPQHPHSASHLQAQPPSLSKILADQSQKAAKRSDCFAQTASTAELLHSILQTFWVMGIRPAIVQTMLLKRHSGL